MKGKISFCLIVALFISCNSNKRIDVSALQSQISEVDSLNNELLYHYNYTLQGIYRISEDSLLADSISRLIIIPDTTVFFEYLGNKISELETLNYITQQEIFFAQDQLIGLKEDAKEKNISQVQFELELESQKQMIDYLKELVNTNTKAIDEIAGELLIKQDSIN